jgi:4-hydroxy-2-oxoglutarate aldolase
VNLSGVFPPIATTFDDRGAVDPDAIRANVARWLGGGVRGIVALGSNGEAPLLDEREADIVIGAVREAVPAGRLLIAGTGRESTRATIDASRRAAALGADAVLVRTPSYFKTRMTPDVLFAHYSALADAIEIPVLLYNYPAVTGISLTAATVARLAAHPNIIGMKETGTDAAQIAAFIEAASGQRFDVIAGSGPGFYAALCLGGAGGILATACVVPRACVALYEAFRRGAHDEARELQRRIVPITQAITTGFGVPGLKAALDLTGYAGGHPRPPLQPAAPDAIEAIKSALAPLQEFL